MGGNARVRLSAPAGNRRPAPAHGFEFPFQLQQRHVRVRNTREIDGYNVTNASVGYRFSSGWEVDVFARNLFDKDYITALTIQTGNSGLILGQPSDPRVVGVTVRAKF